MVENVFGIMSSTFRVFRKPILLEPEKVIDITMTCVLLHNYLRRSKTSKLSYFPLGTFDLENGGEIIPGSWRRDQDDMSPLLPLRRVPRKPAQEVKQIREEFSNYFATNGAVTWQNYY